MVGPTLKRPIETPFTAAEWDFLGDESRAWAIAAAAAVHELQARVGLNSTNSSKPPSTDPPHIKRFRRPPTGRRPGGQPGHPGWSRALVAPERVDRIDDVYPEQCRGCGAGILKRDCEGQEPLRRQIAEIPEIEPFVTEIRCHRASCPKCGTVTVAAEPEGTPRGSFGPSLRALLVVLSGRFRLSRREVVEFGSEALGLQISVGCLDNMCRGIGELLAEPVEQVKREIQTTEVVHPDESGWLQKGVRHWIWVAATKTAAFFRIARSRGSDVAREILGDDFAGLIVSDRWAAYTLIPPERRQVCWAHLKRDFQGFIDRGGSSVAFGKAGLELTKELFTIWHDYESGKIDWPEMQKRMNSVEIEVGRLLAGGTRSKDKKVRGFTKKLLELEPSLFLFSRVPGVEPTNNRAERMLRPVVLLRKGSFGTMSAGGSQFVERMMTVVMTCRLQKRSVLKYLQAVCLAQDQGRKIPCLLKTRSRDGPPGASVPFNARRQTAI